MGDLREITTEEKFYYEVVELRKRLDLIIRDFEAARSSGSDDEQNNCEVIDPRTDRVFNSNERG